MSEMIVRKVAKVRSDAIKTPGGLMLGKRFRKNGNTLIDYMCCGKHDVMTTKQVVECVEGIRIKELIIIPEDDSK